MAATGTHTARIARPFSKKLISRAGYGVMVALLAFSTWEAYRVQSALSRRSLESYRGFLRQDEIVFQLRQSVWRGSISARDFFLSPNPDEAAIFKTQIRQLRFEGLGQLGVLDIPQRRRDEVKATLTEFWFARQREVAGSQILIMLGLSLALGVAVAAFSIRRTEHLERELVQNYEAVAEAKRELEQLSERLIEIQEEERGRLSRELHDEIGQTLTAIRIEVSRSLADPASPEARERLGRARELAERAVQTVRNISLLLRPSVLDDLGLLPAVHWQIEDFSRRSGIGCDFAEEGVQDLLPDAVKTCAYRTVQEALHNCEKHSGATLVRIRLRQTADLLELEILDNGRGAELGSTGMPHGKGRGSGILGMRERIARLGGDLNLSSAPGSGLRLSIRIPLHARGPVAESAPARAAGGAG
ncbi:MAG: sensor histidine kinase [Acidobacteriia bacterium]|nr:sensor histidine kinase [Terriglobia bacterium]